MQADGIVLINSKISDDGLKKGFERIKNDVGAVADEAARMGRNLGASFSKIDISKPIANAQLQIETLEQKLAAVTSDLKLAVEDGDDKSAEKLGAKRVQLYDQLETARKKLAIAVEAAAEKEAKAEEKASQRAIAAEKKEAAVKEKAARKQMERMTKPIRRFSSRFMEILSGALVFNLISAGLREMTSYFGSALKSNEEFRQSFAKLKGALLTAFQPIYEYVLPAIISLMNILTAAVKVIGNFFAALSGKSTSQMSKNAEALYEEAKAIDGVGSAAKKARKQLAGFDEINTVGSQDTGSAGGAGGVSVTPADFSEFNTEEHKAKIDELTAYLSGALLAIGAILAFSGINIPLGIGLMAVGAAGLAAEIALNWDSLKNSLQGTAGGIVAVLSGAFLALGAILAFTGANIPLGIGLMAVGAIGLATAVAANWNAIIDALKGPIGEVIALVSGAVLVLGTILAFSGAALPLGVALMAVGAIGLAAPIVANWNTIKEKLQGPVGKVVAIVSGALLALGAILAFTGANIPLGIGLMAAGAVGMAGVAALNWNTVSEKIKSILAGLLAIISGAGLVLGVLLCLTGVGLGLGLALIFAGLAGTKAAWNLDDNPVTRFVKNLANGIINIINDIIDAVNSLFHINFKGLNIGGVQVIPSIDTRLINLPKIPLLAQGAVIPPNAPFMAVLGDQKHGTNVEAPLSTIQEAVALVMEDYAASNLAGHEATVAVLREILEAVLGIEVGDDVIGKAVSRYSSRLATMRGDA